MIVNHTIFFIKKGIIFSLSFYLLLIVFAFTLSDKLIFLPPAVGYQYNDELITIQSRNANDNSTTHPIVAHLLHNPKSTHTIIYSHGNAVDLSGIKHVQEKFFRYGHSVIIYDYSGYGLSKGRVSEQQVYNDVQAVYDYLITQKKLKPNQIISYGHSLGAAIATDLAFNNPLAALVLENPFTTAFTVKTIYPVVPFDKFKNINKIDKVNTALFITHSFDDSIIPFKHGKSLYDSAKEPKTSLWLNGAGHTKITHKGLFWAAFNEFVSTLTVRN